MKRDVFYSIDSFVWPQGGVKRYYLELLPRIAKMGRTCAVSRGVYCGILDQAAFANVALKKPFVHLPVFRGALRIANIFNSLLEPVNGLNSNMIYHPTYYRRLPTKRSAARVVTVYDMIHEIFWRDEQSSSDTIRYKRAMVEASDAVLVISESTRRDLIELLKVPKEKIFVTYLAGTTFPAASAVPGIRPNNPFVLWVGARSRYKNFNVLARAFGQSAAPKGLSLYCVGGGAFNASERDLLVELGISDRCLQVNLADAELRWAYENAAALAYTSLYEGFGIPIVEALSFGCPVLTSNTSSMPEAGGDVAVYADPKCVESIVFGLETALAQGRGAEQVAKRTAHAAQFSWDRCARATEAVYARFD